MTTRNELHKAIRIVLAVIDYLDLPEMGVDNGSLEGSGIAWETYDNAIVTLQSVINEE